LLGATPVNARVVHDRNRITGGGVTAGLDFGLTLASLLRSREEPEWIQLVIEYAPAPPFNAGLPDTAPRAVYERLMRAGPRRFRRRAKRPRESGRSSEAEARDVNLGRQALESRR